MKETMDKDKCCKCGKDMSPIGDSPRIEGVRVTISLENPTPDKIAYINKQLGKYSNGSGECVVAICYECYIDGLFHIDKTT